MLRWLIFGSIRIALAIFFRRIEVTGDVPRRAAGARLLYGNHHNGLVDPALVLSSTPAAVSVLGKAPLWKLWILRPFLAATRAVPVARRQDAAERGAEGGTGGQDAVDNRAMFAAVIERLEQGGNVLIFPEGISHDAPAIAPFKTGAARILLGTSGDTAATFQPVHLGFDAKAIFRSRALVHFGAPYSLEPYRARLESGEDEREVVRALTADMQRELEALVPLAGDPAAQQLLDRVATLALHPEPEPHGDGREPSLEARRAAFLRARRAWEALRRDDDPRVEPLRERVDAYFEALYEAGLSDHEVVRGSRRRAWGELLGSVVMSLLVSPIALLGCLLYAPPYHLVRLVTRRVAREPDIVSSAKLLIGYVVFPISAIIYCALVALLTTGWMVPLGFLTVLASAFAALALLERLATLARVTAWLRMRLQKAPALARLKGLRFALLVELAEVERAVAEHR